MVSRLRLRLGLGLGLTVDNGEQVARKKPQCRATSSLGGALTPHSVPSSCCNARCIHCPVSHRLHCPSPIAFTVHLCGFSRLDFVLSPLRPCPYRYLGISFRPARPPRLSAFAIAALPTLPAPTTRPKPPTGDPSLSSPYPRHPPHLSEPRAVAH
jgi:hypothetical protein